MSKKKIDSSCRIISNLFELGRFSAERRKEIVKLWDDGYRIASLYRLIELVEAKKPSNHIETREGIIYGQWRTFTYDVEIDTIERHRTEFVELKNPYTLEDLANLRKYMRYARKVIHRYFSLRSLRGLNRDQVFEASSYLKEEKGWDCLEIQARLLPIIKIGRTPKQVSRICYSMFRKTFGWKNENLELKEEVLGDLFEEIEKLKVRI